MSNVIGFDTETHLIGAENLAPKLVCLTVCDDGGKDIFVEDAGDAAVEICDPTTDDVRTAHNLKFDLGVLANYDPSLIPAIFELLMDGRLQCTRIRERLINLTAYGDMDFIYMPDGTKFKVSYSLADLVKFHFRVDLSASKNDEDAWRTNYAMLEDIPLSDWPQEAIDYAISDAEWAVKLWELQEVKRREIIEQVGVDPFNTLELQCTSDFCLHMMSCWGMAVDPAEYLKIKKLLEEELAPEKMQPLYDADILRPGSPPRPHANGAKNPDGTPKMTAGTKESCNTKALAALVEQACKEQGIPVRMTEPSGKFPEGQIQTSEEVIADLKDHHPLLEVYHHRQTFQKLVTTELPRMEWDGVPAPVVHPCYDVLKRSGRTSSMASKLHPSFNCQNVDPRVRNCFIPRPGFVLYSADYGYMELCTLAQTCLNLFGKSVLAEVINSGRDPHSYLGAQIAKATCDWFGEEASDDRDECYEQFMRYKEIDEKWFGHYRTFAKPTGLGYPGGLRPATFIKYAKATYGIIIDLETATNLREIWEDAFFEMPAYFDHINNNCVDPVWSSGYEGRVYRYETPLGMLRPNADYCSAANGLGLQSPSAEGAKLGVINVVRAQLDPTVGSILYGHSRNICFVHDENIGEVREDEMMHERAQEVGRLMVEGMKVVCPDINIKAEPVLMRRWDKDAKPVYVDGQLTVWEKK